MVDAHGNLVVVPIDQLPRAEEGGTFAFERKIQPFPFSQRGRRHPGSRRGSNRGRPRFSAGRQREDRAENPRRDLAVPDTGRGQPVRDRFVPRGRKPGFRSRQDEFRRRRSQQGRQSGQDRRATGSTDFRTQAAEPGVGPSIPDFARDILPVPELSPRELWEERLREHQRSIGGGVPAPAARRLAGPTKVEVMPGGSAGTPSLPLPFGFVSGPAVPPVIPGQFPRASTAGLPAGGATDPSLRRPVRAPVRQPTADELARQRLRATLTPERFAEIRAAADAEAQAHMSGQATTTQGMAGRRFREAMDALFNNGRDQFSLPLGPEHSTSPAANSNNGVPPPAPALVPTPTAPPPRAVQTAPAAGVPAPAPGSEVGVGQVGPVSADVARLFLTDVQRDALRRGGFTDPTRVSPLRVSAPGTSQYLQQLSASVAGTLGFGPSDLFFEELQRLRPTRVRGGVARRTG